MIAYVYSDTVNSGCVTCEINVMNRQYDNFANDHVHLFVIVFSQCHELCIKNWGMLIWTPTDSETYRTMIY